jgi:hypothetical protein
MTFFSKTVQLLSQKKIDSVCSPTCFWEETNKLETVVSLYARYQSGQFLVMGHVKVKSHKHGSRTGDNLKKKVFNL